MRLPVKLLLPALLLLAVPSAARAEGVPAACPGDPINVDQVITGEFDTSLQGSYVLVPFDVPAGTTSVRVKYCFDQPAAPTPPTLRHTLDLGLYETRSGAAPGFGEQNFRGWGGSSHPDVTVTPQGFSSEAEYLAKPKGHVPGRTTRGYVPGPIPPGQWAAELGVAAVVSQAEGDADGKVAWRLEVERSSDPAFAAQPYRPARYSARPAKGAGWYAGDLHVHAEHSALGDSTMTEVFNYAFGTARLDFVTLTDYVTPSAWGEVGRYQGAHRGKLIARSSEVITYRGHTNNQVSERYVDYRTGPVYERQGDGSLTRVREPSPPRNIFAKVQAVGGWTQVNHPTIFPSSTPGFANVCRGCPWDYSDAETDWKRVNAFEVNTGPATIGGAPNPFTATAIGEWDALRKRGFPLTGVSVSDSHDAGTPNGPTESPVGNGRTVVYADELSEDGVRRAVQAGHAYVKNFADSPEIRFTAEEDGRVAIMGDAIPTRSPQFTVNVRGGGGMTLNELRDGKVINTEQVEGSNFTHEFTARSRGEYRVQIEKDGVVHGLSNPIAVGRSVRPIPRGIRAGNARAALRLRARSVRRRGTRVQVTFEVRSNGGALLDGVRVRSGRASGYTDSRGRVTLTLRNVFEPGRFVARATGAEWRSARATFRVR